MQGHHAIHLSDALSRLGNACGSIADCSGSEVEGSNPSSPATTKFCQARARRLWEPAASEELRRRELLFTGRTRLVCCPAAPPSASADRSSAVADQRISRTASLRERPAISV